MSKNTNVRVTITNARLSFPHLFEAWKAPGDPNSKPKFGASFLLNKKVNADDIKKVTAAINSVLASKGWKPAMLKSKCAREASEVINNQTGEALAGYDNEHVVVNANSQRRPLIVNPRNEPVVETDNLFYGGCYVDATFDIYGYDKVAAHGKRICAELIGVRFRRDGEAFGASRPKDAEEVFGAAIEEDVL